MHDDVRGDTVVDDNRKQVPHAWVDSRCDNGHLRQADWQADLLHSQELYLRRES